MSNDPERPGGALELFRLQKYFEPGRGRAVRELVGVSDLGEESREMSLGADELTGSLGRDGVVPLEDQDGSGATGGGEGGDVGRFLSLAWVGVENEGVDLSIQWPLSTGARRPARKGRRALLGCGMDGGWRGWQPGSIQCLIARKRREETCPGRG